MNRHDHNNLLKTRPLAGFFFALTKATLSFNLADAVKPPNFRLTPLKHLCKQLRPPANPNKKQFCSHGLLTSIHTDFDSPMPFMASGFFVRRARCFSSSEDIDVFRHLLLNVVLYYLLINNS
uniref:Uncharacterized protein n=2 Tax=Escherichia TaxID=561 RepID=A0A7L8KA23_ECOLX|nr:MULTISPECIES: hypothetical protein [Enterobacterales]QOE89720.1 hypothetical protein [Escherichia coli]UCK65622.1 hypothetical protein [Providencia rettgeri]WAT94246.1 hypothetical protein OS905_00610 [Escherichia sp. J-18004577]